MSNPRLIAEDVARHYFTRLNPYAPHSKNVHRHLRRPVLAITKRILLPRDGYDGDHIEKSDDNDNVVDGIPYEEEEALAEDGKDPERRRRDTSNNVEGMDWMDYLPPVSDSFDSDVSDSENEARELKTLDPATADESEPGVEAKLTLRSIARMHAFLGSISLVLPNHPIIPAVADSNTVKPMAKPLLSNLQSRLASVAESTSLWKRPPPKPQPSSHQTFHAEANAASSLTAALSGFSPPVPPRTKIRRQHSHRPFPQITSQKLTVALEIYIRTLRRIHTHQTECVLPHEPRRNLLSRIRTLLTSLVSTAGTVGSVRSTLTRLLRCLTRELLAVEFLSEEVEGMVRRIVLEYEHLTSFASLAFLSSPGDSADAHLKPLVVGYVEYLMKEWVVVVEGCKLEYVLMRAMDPEMRRFFKTASFSSIGHLLEACSEHAEHLENIVVQPVGKDFEIGSGSTNTFTNGSCGKAMDPAAKGQPSPPSAIPYSFDFQSDDPTKNNKAVKQALRDLRREVLIVNGHILPPVHGLKELVNLLRETLHSRPLKLKDSCVGTTVKKTRSRRTRAASITSPKTSPTSSSGNTPSAAGSGSETSHSKPTGLTDGSETETDFLSSGNEGDTDGSRPRGAVLTAVADGEHPPAPVRAGKRRHFNVEAIDIMTRRLLIAASRTGTGGDAFFVVRDLFGGEDVEVVTSEQSVPYGHMPRKISDCTIELTVRLASIVIKCHSKFDVYPKQLVGECEPLIQLFATNTEVIQLQEVRAKASTRAVDTCNTNDEDTPTVLILQEKKTETTGQRIVSIRPATYEKIENWKTPS